MRKGNIYQRNNNIAKIFYRLADYYEMDDVPFKPDAYRRGAMAIEILEQDVSHYYQKKQDQGRFDIPGIGESLSRKIVEYLKTGKIRLYEQFKKKIPIDFDGLGKIEGLGPKRIGSLYKKLGVKNVVDLENALANHKVAKIAGFGNKSEENLIEGLRLLKKGERRFPLAKILPKVDEIITYLKNLTEVKKIVVAGSVRRQKETVGDVDILAVATNPKKVMAHFVKMPGVTKIWGVGETKASVALREGYDVDLRIVPLVSFGAALLYFTGTRDHNIYLRKVAMGKGLKLNEYGLFQGRKFIAGKTEEEIYKALGLKYLPPQKRI